MGEVRTTQKHLIDICYSNCFKLDRCPKLERIDNKLCNACVHHDYVYRVRVIKEVDTNGWFRYRVSIVDVSSGSVLACQFVCLSQNGKF